jgi:hypothetical protein
MRRKSSYRIDMLGQRVGRLLVIEYAGSSPTSQGALWKCRCDCGNVVVRKGAYLRTAGTRSCGCLNLDRLHARRTHGSPPEHRCWDAMIRRCYSAKNPNYRYYGGRGITVCKRWRTSFEAFLTDMGPRPSAQHSIERIDNDRGYEPSNCRWGTKLEQMRNRRHCPTCTCLSNPF